VRFVGADRAWSTRNGSAGTPLCQPGQTAERRCWAGGRTRNPRLSSKRSGLTRQACRRFTTLWMCPTIPAGTPVIDGAGRFSEACGPRPSLDICAFSAHDPYFAHRAATPAGMPSVWARSFSRELFARHDLERCFVTWVRTFWILSKSNLPKLAISCIIGCEEQFQLVGVC
jgi:hypothetical protein